MSSCNFNFLVWNVRGLNDRAHRAAVRSVVTDARCSVACLQETKLDDIPVTLAAQFLSANLSDFLYLPADETRGGILLAWDQSVASCDSLSLGDFSLTARLQFVDGSSQWITVVYGPQAESDKLRFLQELRDIRNARSGPWVVAGDFNLIYQDQDKNNANLNRRMMGRFRRAINDLSLHELHLNGRSFTWSNGWTNPTLERLDRIFYTSDWEDMFPQCFLKALPSTVSDHCPLLLSTYPVHPRGGRFRFESFWCKLEGFEEVVRESWSAPCSTVDPVARLDRKLRTAARKLRSWSDKKVGNVKLQMEMARELIGRFDKAEESRILSLQERFLHKNLKLKYLALASLERTMARQRSRITWLQEGDANTRFFHQQAAARKRRNFIQQLEHNEAVATSPEEKDQLAHEYFTNLLGSAHQRSFSLDMGFLQQQGASLPQLETPFTEEEVWAAIRDTPRDKAPGPDGFTGLFYHTCWQILRQDVMEALHQLHRMDGSTLGKVNKALLTLLPKTQDARNLKDFRPISLLHSFAKLFAKILSRRLAPLLDSLVAPNQSAFIKRRCIQDNFMLVRQSAKKLHQRKQSALLLKLDIAQAFDSISWQFILEVLKHKGFGDRWCAWVAMLFRTATTRVLINGNPGNEIHHR